MKPIEPGCKAMIVGLRVDTEDNYKIVEVVKKVFFEEEGGWGWACEGPVCDFDGEQGVAAYAQENLIRIDDDFPEDDARIYENDKEVCE